MFNAIGVQTDRPTNQVTSACNYARSWLSFCDITFTWQIYASGRDSKEYTWHS